MKPKKYFLELPLHSELVEKDKSKYKNVVQWKYEQSGDGRFLNRDQVLRQATYPVQAYRKSPRISRTVATLIVIFILMCGYFLQQIIFG